MARQRSGHGRRTRGSWIPRIAGIVVVILIATGGAIAYLVGTQARASGHGPRLPTRVQSVQTVGIVAEVPGGAGRSTPVQLRFSSAGGLQFDPIPAGQVTRGDPEWTADTMAGGTYVFIYAPTGQCLASALRGVRPVLALRHCDLSADQRWQPVNGTTSAGRHRYGEYRNLGRRRCLAAGAAGTGTRGGATAGLARCNPIGPASQLVSFWWAA